VLGEACTFNAVANRDAIPGVADFQAMGLRREFQNLGQRRCNVKPSGSGNYGLVCHLPRNHSQPHEWGKHEPKHGNDYDGPWWREYRDPTPDPELSDLITRLSEPPQPPERSSRRDSATE
jgi:hypothetical protein